MRETAAAPGSRLSGLTFAPVRFAQTLRSSAAFSPESLRETASGLNAPAPRSLNGGTRLSLRPQRPSAPSLRRFISGSCLTGAEPAPLARLRPLRPPLPIPLRSPALWPGSGRRLLQSAPRTADKSAFFCVQGMAGPLSPSGGGASRYQQPCQQSVLNSSCKQKAVQSVQNRPVSNPLNRRGCY